MRKITQEEVLALIKKWDETKQYTYNHSSINKLFKNFPSNTNIEEVMIKVAAISSIYSTQTKNIYYVAKNITEISDIDDRIKKGDPTIINEIAKKTIFTRTEASLASKYCSFCNPNKYPIHDKNVRLAFEYYLGIQEKESRELFRKDYRNFLKYFEDFKESYKDIFSDKDNLFIDKFLWLKGNELKERNK